MSRRYPFDPFEREPFAGPREIRFTRPPRRVLVGGSLFLLAILLFVFTSPIVGIITDLQWYDALGLSDVFTTRLSIQWGLFIGSFLTSFLYLAVNLLVALRVRSGPGLRADGTRRTIVR